MSSNQQNPIPPGSGSMSERRMAKYKEERRRQLASQIANRLSSNHSSSSSDENDEGSNNSLEKYAKYRRHHHRSSRAAQAEQSDSAPTVTRRRRRRSVTKESASPAHPVSKPVVPANPIKNANDADGEDNGLREDSPEHIYHQIGTSEVIRVSKKRSPSPSQRRPRVSSKEIDPGENVSKAALPLRPRAVNASEERPTQRPKPEPQRPLLNTSYSSEEILLQAASSLQGLEGNKIQQHPFLTFLVLWGT